MHELFTNVLSKRDLSRAGDLFSVPDKEIVHDIAEVIIEITDIVSQSDYLKNSNDQSVVEICVTRVLSCIRETKTADLYCPILIELLKTCLIWNLQPSVTTKEDPPHAKIAADIISSIFLNYNKREVMKLALPIAVQFLPKGNRELSRNLASYISLAAIDYAYLLSPHVDSIINSIITGNFGLLRVLSQLYEVSPDTVCSHVPQLVNLLPECDAEERLAVFQLYLLIAQKQPWILEPCIAVLCDFLYDSESSIITMQILLKVAEHKPLLIVEHFEKISLAAKTNANTLALAAQVLSLSGCIHKDHAQYALDFVLEQLPLADRSSQAVLLQEATKLCSSFPILFTDKVLSCVRQKNALSQEKLSYMHASVNVGHKTSGSVTVVNLNDSTAAEYLSTATTTTINMHSKAVPGVIANEVHSITGTNLINDMQHSSFVSTDTVINPTSVSVATMSIISPHSTNGRTHSRSSPCSPKESQRKNIITGHMKIPSTTTGNNNLGTINAGMIVPPTPPHIGYTRRVKLGDSRSTGRLHPTGNTHRSMTRLNVAGGSVGGLHKSMTRLSSSQHINQKGSALTSVSNMVNNVNSSNNVLIQSVTGVHGLPPTSKTTGQYTVTGTTLTSFSINSSLCSLGYVTPVPPLSKNVIITGQNKWGLPSTQVTSCDVTVTSTTNKIWLQSPGSGVLQNNTTAFPKYNSDITSQSLGTIAVTSIITTPLTVSAVLTSITTVSPITSTNNNTVSVHYVSPVMPFQNILNKKSVMKLPINGNCNYEVIVTGPTTNVTARTRNDNISRTLLNVNNSIMDQRMSTFEPYQIMRDPVQQFCEKHFASIRTYMDEVSKQLPSPTRCSIEERRTKKVAKLHFVCQIRGPHCLYSKTCFTMRTRNPKTWIHLMFLDFQMRHYVKEKCVLSTREPGVSNLKNIWQILKCENRNFTELVTSQFPNHKDREILVNELRHSGFLDVFEVSKTEKNSLHSNELEYQWGCFLCNHPDKAVGFLNDSNQPMIEGQLKEKKGKWRLFRRWRTRYFTLSGAHLSCKGSSGGESIDINQIRSVKVSRGARNIPKAFEIFTADQTLILKPKDGKNAEEWVQCLSIVVAHSQARDNPTTKTNSLPARTFSKPSF